MNLQHKLERSFDSILDDLRNINRGRNIASNRPNVTNINGDVIVNNHRPITTNPCREVYMGECVLGRSSGIHPIANDIYERKYTQAANEPKKNSAFSQPKTKENNIMSLFNNIPGLTGASFGKVSDKRIAVGFDGQVVFRTPQGSYVKVTTDAEGNRVQESVLDLKLDVDFYRVPAQTLSVGDLIELDGQFLYVEENAKGGLKFINPLTGNKSSKLQQTNIFGLHFYSKIVSLFELGGAQQGVGLGGINPIMLMALQGKSGAKGDISELLVLSSLMGAQQPGGAPGGIFGGAQGGISPIMLMALGGDSDNDSFKQMMMLQMMAGQGGANPFAPASAVVPAATVVAAAKAAPRRSTVKPATKTAHKAVPKSTPAKAASKAPVKAASKSARASAQRKTK